MGVRKEKTEKGREEKRDACVSDWDSWLLSCVVPESTERGIERKREIAHIWESARKRQKKGEGEIETHAFRTVTHGSCHVWCQNLETGRTREREKMRKYGSRGERGRGRERKRDALVSDCDSWLLSCVVPEPRDRGIQRKREIMNV